ncbi:MAG TPA: Yip1 family protein [Flavobacterium sp.]|jgi:hypothetical protein
MEEFEEFQEKITMEDNLLVKIWTEPRDVFRFVHKYNYDKYVIGLLLLAGISRAFDQAVQKDLGNTQSLQSIIIMCVTFGGLFGWIGYYLYAVLISWTGKLLDGKSSSRSILRILAYALIPSIVALALLIPQLAVYGAEVFREDGHITTASWIGNAIFYTAVIGELTLGVWSLVLCVIGISEIQNFSIGKAIVNLLLPIAFILIPFLLIALVIYLVT